MNHQKEAGDNTVAPQGTKRVSPARFHSLRSRRFAAAGANPSSGRFISELDLLENRIMPLPGAVAPRPWEPGSRILLPLGANSTDLITLYEHVATVRHRGTKIIYVIARETEEALYHRRPTASGIPRRVLTPGENGAELRISFFVVTNTNIGEVLKRGAAEWWHGWLRAVDDEDICDSLTEYLLVNRLINPEMTGRKGR